MEKVKGRFTRLFEFMEGYRGRTIASTDFMVEAMVGLERDPPDDYEEFYQDLTKFRRLNTWARQAAVRQFYKRKLQVLSASDNPILIEQATRVLLDVRVGECRRVLFSHLAELPQESRVEYLERIKALVCKELDDAKSQGE